VYKRQPQIPLFSGEVGEGRRFADTELLQGGHPSTIVTWLAGEDSGFTTGADFSCNGGLHMG